MSGGAAVRSIARVSGISAATGKCCSLAAPLMILGPLIGAHFLLLLRNKSNPINMFHNAIDTSDECLQKLQTFLAVEG
jgi:hypothetical protein